MNSISSISGLVGLGYQLQSQQVVQKAASVSSTSDSGLTVSDLKSLLRSVTSGSQLLSTLEQQSVFARAASPYVLAYQGRSQEANSTLRAQAQDTSASAAVPPGLASGPASEAAAAALGDIPAETPAIPASPSTSATHGNSGSHENASNGNHGPVWASGTQPGAAAASTVTSTASNTTAAAGAATPAPTSASTTSTSSATSPSSTSTAPSSTSTSAPSSATTSTSSPTSTTPTTTRRRAASVYQATATATSSGGPAGRAAAGPRHRGVI